MRDRVSGTGTLNVQFSLSRKTFYSEIEFFRMTLQVSYGQLIQFSLATAQEINQSTNQSIIKSVNFHRLHWTFGIMFVVLAKFITFIMGPHFGLYFKFFFENFDYPTHLNSPDNTGSSYSILPSFPLLLVIKSLVRVIT